jgi:hypothetical protein
VSTPRPYMHDGSIATFGRCASHSAAVMYSAQYVGTCMQPPTFCIISPMSIKRRKYALRIIKGNGPYLGQGIWRPEALPALISTGSSKLGWSCGRLGVSTRRGGTPERRIHTLAQSQSASLWGCCVFSPRSVSTV